MAGAASSLDVADATGNGITVNGEIEVKPDGLNLPQIVCDGAFNLDDIERETIVATLLHNQGHRQKSAKALGIGVRTLGLKLKKWKEQQIVAETL